MPYLAHTSELPSNAEWSYLYAIADVYSNYSSPSFSRWNPDAPEAFYPFRFYSGENKSVSTH